ncbi:MAG TPA: Mo-dependent nitrogenase C-terminal domain-containing protein [Cyanophyceae cyanobacterium]
MNCGSTLTSKIYGLGKAKILHFPNQNWLLQVIWQWLDGIEVHNPKLARFLCQLIPAHCPFERTIKFFGHTLLYIPPLCKLNPFYNQLMALRFRALSFLADTCGEDIAKYCCSARTN